MFLGKLNLLKHLASIISFSLVLAMFTPMIALNISSDYCIIEFNEIAGEESSESKDKDGNEKFELDDCTLFDHEAGISNHAPIDCADLNGEVNPVEEPMIQTPPPELPS